MNSKIDRDDIGRRFMGSLEKAFHILETLSAGPAKLGLSDLSRLSGVERSATQRIVFTLKRMGYIQQERVTKLYSLSPRILRFGSAFLHADRVRSVSEPVLRAVNEQCEETVNLTELAGTDVVYVLRFASRHVVSVDLSVGSVLPAYCTAPGRAMMAHLSDHGRDEILLRSAIEKRTPHTRTGLDEIRLVIDAVRNDGFCLSNQEAFLGDISVSAPVFDERGAIAAAVNIAVPYPRWSPERVYSELMPLVVTAARQISYLMAEGKSNHQVR